MERLLASRYLGGLEFRGKAKEWAVTGGLGPSGLMSSLMDVDKEIVACLCVCVCVCVCEREREREREKDVMPSLGYG